MDSISNRQKQIIEEFSQLSDWEERYKKIIQLGKLLPELPADKKTEEFRVRGCQSQVWLHAHMENGKVIFEGDSDAVLVRGLVALLLRVFSQATPQEILAASLDFIKDIGLESKLSPSRANGVFSMIKQIKYYAMAFEVAASR